MTRALVSVATVALIAAVYGQAWSAQWVMEDISAAMTATHSLTLTPRGFTAWTWAFVRTPESAHLLNLSLHVLIAGLVGALARRLGLSLLAQTAVMGGLLVHPLLVEGTAYAASRGELLACAAVVLACGLVTTEGRGRVVAAFGLVAFGVWCKESAIVGAVLIPLTHASTQPRTWRWSALGGSLLAASVVWVYGGLRAVVNIELYAHDVTALDWLLVQMTATLRLCGMFVTGIGMTPDYDYDLVPMGLRVLSLLSVLGLAGLAALLWRSHRGIAYGLAFTLIAVAPRWIVQTPRSYLNEHQFYLPSVGLLLAAGAGVQALQREAVT